jgi:hypothetical protein
MGFFIMQVRYLGGGAREGAWGTFVPVSPLAVRLCDGATCCAGVLHFAVHRVRALSAAMTRPLCVAAVLPGQHHGAGPAVQHARGHDPRLQPPRCAARGVKGGARRIDLSQPRKPSLCVAWGMGGGGAHSSSVPPPHVVSPGGGGGGALRAFLACVAWFASASHPHPRPTLAPSPTNPHPPARLRFQQRVPCGYGG